LKINRTTSKSVPLISAGPQKPQKLTASKIKYEKKFGPKFLNLIEKWIFWCPNISSKVVMTYFMFVLLRPCRNDREQF
jgi:hypothetical protein